MKTESIWDFTKTGVMRRNIFNIIIYVKYSPVLRVVAAPAPTEREREREREGQQWTPGPGPGHTCHAITLLLLTV